MPPVTQNARKSEGFIGLFRPEHTKSEISRLGGINDYFFTDRYECQFDRLTGTWDHADICDTAQEEVGWICEYEYHARARRYLSRLQTRPFLHVLFCNPSLAAEHESMDEQELLIRPL